MRSLILALCLLLAPLPLASAQPPPTKSQNAPKSAVITSKGSYTDIKQGNAGTCWILSSIAAMEYNGYHFENRIHYEGKNWYTVKLYNFNTPATRPAGGMHSETERVYFDGTTTPVDPVFNPKDPRAAWVVIMQRAVVQALHDWDPSQVITNPHSGGAGDALALLSGQFPTIVGVQDANVKKAVQAAMAARKVVVFGTTGAAKTLVGNHNYAVLGASSQGVTLYNPWGSRLTVSWNVITQEGSEFFIN
jgi:hypothetical protein